MGFRPIPNPAATREENDAAVAQIEWNDNFVVLLSFLSSSKGALLHPSRLYNPDTDPKRRFSL